MSDDHNVRPLSPPQHAAAYLCPGCGATLPPQPTACPRCGLQFGATARNAQIERQLHYPAVSPSPAPVSLPAGRPASPAAAPPPPAAAPPQNVPPEAAVSADHSRRSPRVKRLVIIGICLFFLLLLIAVIVNISTGAGGYNSSPERLVDGLNKALEEGDMELLLSLISEDERSMYADGQSISTSFHIDVVDVLEGKNKRYALILVKGDGGYFSGYMTSLAARKEDGAWYLERSYIRQFLA